MKNNLSKEEEKKIKSKILESLAFDRRAILVKFPFFGNILLKLHIIPTRDKRIRTAQTDGKRIFFDIDFYLKLKDKERVFVLAHEVIHCILMHLVRIQSRDPLLYNIAADMETNYLLKKQSTKGDIIAPPKLYYPPKQLEGKSSEVIYEWLLNKYNERKQQARNQDSSSENLQDSNNELRNNPGTSTSSRNAMKNRNCRKEDDESSLCGQFDDHYFGRLPDKDYDNEKVEDQWGEVGYDDDYAPEISDDFASSMRRQILTEIQRCETMNKGDIPAGLKSLLECFILPEISWKNVLQQFVCSCYGDKRNWLPPSRRQIYNEMYFQSRRSERIKVAVVVDTSGSCRSDLVKFFTEINALLKSFGDYDLHVIQCDADVNKADKYDIQNPFPIDNPNAIEIKGFGGSDFRPACKFLNQKGIENDVDCIVFFTDGCIDFPKYPPSKPSLIILTANGNEQCCKWGRKIKFKNS